MNRVANRADRALAATGATEGAMREAWRRDAWAMWASMMNDEKLDGCLS